MSPKLPPKRDVMLALLEQAESIFVNLDPRREGVLLPPQLKRGPRVLLQYGMNMQIPIPDLDIGVEGIGATLSFDGRPSFTFVPWKAVFAIMSREPQRGVLWEEDVPAEVELEKKGDPKGPAAAPATRPGAAAKKKEGVKRPVLRAVEGGRDAEGETPPSPTPPASRAQKPQPVLKMEREQPVPAGTRPPTAAGVDDIVEPPQRDRKKKRELPPYLRIVK